MLISANTITRKRFTVDEYHRMADIGLFPGDSRLELIRGEILEMPEAQPAHSGRVNRLNHLFMTRLGESVIVSIQNPSSVDDYSEPVPDISLLKPRPDFYTRFHPLPEDVFLVVEVASTTTLRFDRRIKAPLYAEAGIPEYWILNIPENVLEIRLEPVQGRYTKQEILKRGQVRSPLAFPNVFFRADDILGQTG